MRSKLGYLINGLTNGSSHLIILKNTAIAIYKIIFVDILINIYFQNNYLHYISNQVYFYFESAPKLSLSGL